MESSYADSEVCSKLHMDDGRRKIRRDIMMHIILREETSRPESEILDDLKK